jgi:hypothetical protein
MAANGRTMRRNLGIPTNLLLLILLGAWFTSCTGSKKITAETKYEAQKEFTPQIIFLNYSVERDSLEGYKIELINKIVTEGKAKPDIYQHGSPKDGDLLCITLDSDKQPISKMVIPDPLIKRAEYQQDDGSLASKQVVLDHSDFSVRMQLDSASHFISIDRFNPAGSSNLIITEIN